MTGGLIVLVEDNPDDEFMTLRALRKNRIENPIEVLRDGAEAVDWVESTGRFAGRASEPAPLVILLDLNLPKLSGLAVLERLRAHASTRLVPVVVLTTSADEPDVRSAYERGANGFVTKPVGFAEFTTLMGHLGMFWLLTNRAPPTPSA